VHVLSDRGGLFANVQAVVPLGRGMTKLRPSEDYVRVCHRDAALMNGSKAKDELTTPSLSSAAQRVSVDQGYGRTSRRYRIPGTDEAYDSVTSILSAIGKPALISWAANQERALVMEHAPRACGAARGRGSESQHRNPRGSPGPCAGSMRRSDG
jgi:hypothetical protein